MSGFNITIGITVILVTAATVIWSNRKADRMRAAMKEREA